MRIDQKTLLIILCSLIVTLNSMEKEEQPQSTQESTQTSDYDDDRVLDTTLTALAALSELSDDQIKTIKLILLTTVAHGTLDRVTNILHTFSHHIDASLIVLIMQRQRTILKVNIEHPTAFEQENRHITFDQHEQADQSWNTALLEDFFYLSSIVPFLDFKETDNYQLFLDKILAIYKHALQLCLSEEQLSTLQEILEDLLIFISININAVCDEKLDIFLGKFDTHIPDIDIKTIARTHAYANLLPDLTAFFGEDMRCTTTSSVFTDIADLYNSNQTSTETAQGSGEQTEEGPVKKRRRLEQVDSNKKQ